MKRFLTLLLCGALLAGMAPAWAAVEDDPAAWQVMYEDGKAGYVDGSGNWTVPPQYDIAYPFDETGYAVVECYLRKDNGEGDSRCGLIDRTGAYAAQPVYQSIWWPADSYGGGRVFQTADGHYGIMEADGTVRVETVSGVDALHGFQHGVAVYRLGEMEGLMDPRGEPLTEALYDSLFVEESGFVTARKNGRYGALALDGAVTVPLIYNQLSDFSISRPNLVGVRLGELWGLCNLETGELAVPCAFQNTDEANVALALGAESREEIYPAVVEACRERGLSVAWQEPGAVMMRRYGTERVVLVKDGLAALYGLDGARYTDFIFDAVGEFDACGHAVALKNGKWGKIGLDGGTVAEFIYDTEGEAAMEASARFVSQWGDGAPSYALARLDGTLLTEYKFWRWYPFSNGFALVSDGQEGYAYIDETGKAITPLRYDAMDSQFGSTPFEADGFAIVQNRESRRRNVIDSTGRELLPEDHYKVWRAGCGLFGFSDGLGGGVGFIDGTGTVVIQPRFTYMTNPKGMMEGNTFDEETGLARVCLNGVWITINTEGNRAEESREAASDYQEGLTPANHYGPGEGWSGGPWGFQNEAGEWLVPQIFDTVGHFDRDYAAVYSMGRYGLLKNLLNREKTSDWATGELARAKAAGYVTPRCETYQTYTITRLQFAELAVNYLEKATGKTIASAPSDAFTDTSDEAVLKAYAAGIVQGTGEGRFSPDSPLTREQLTAMLWRAMEKAGATVQTPADLAAYADGEAVSNWAAEGMAALAGLGILSGTGENSLSPKAACSVEQAVLLTWRAAK